MNVISLAGIGRYWKTITAAVGVAASVVTALNIHATWVPVLLAAATALGVYAVPNTPALPKAGEHEAGHATPPVAM